jgi:DNA polymerase-3 subunit alpha
MARPDWVEVPRWDEKDRLKNEKMALGFYLSGHPFHAWTEELKGFVRTRLDRLSVQREPQLLAGIVYAVRTQMTRRGKMGVVVLDDGSARVEVVVYSELFESARRWLKEDQLLLAEARVGNRRGDEGGTEELRISADQLFDLEGARSRYAKCMRLHCNGLSNAEELGRLLAPYLGRDEPDAAHPGCPVSVVYRNQEAACELELGAAWRVSLRDDLLQSLRARFDAGGVEVLY